MNESIYLVRKHGSVKVENKGAAEKLITAAAAAGYNFGQKKVGWSFVVSDQDN